nr:PREDICTED: ribonuclease Z, mitochondrial isoform X2 [Tribolium castaneum]|eukprot:XP_008197361.1 PREDICTED: ribonuclease Z, mitochondrial isoform X2 [Tribolium castaneum]
MPKEKTHIPEAQKQRRKIKEKFSKYSPGRVTLQVLGTGAEGAPRSLYVFSDQSRYLFNCGEGTQRLAHEHKMKLAKLEHIFITRPTWANIGGLPGAALTIQDVGVPEITLHGPQGLEEIFIATRRFIVIKDLDIKMAQCDENTTFEDNVLKVKYVPLKRSGNSSPISEPKNSNLGQMQEDNIDYYAHEHSGRRKSPPKISESKLLQQKNKPTNFSMAYICQLQPRPGALLLDKCVSFGVPPGPLLGQLKSGHDVTLVNGKVVKASDVCEPDDPGPVFIVLECPSEEYLDSLIDCEEFKKHQETATKDEDLAHTVVHFTPQKIINHPRYKEWVDKFSPSTHHLILNDSNTCMGSSAVHRIQYKLNLLSDDIFPLLGDKGTQTIDDQVTEPPQPKKIKPDSPSLPIDQLSVKSRPASPTDPNIYTNTLFNYHLRPKKACDRSNELKLVPSQFIDETMAIENFPSVLHEVTQQMAQKRRHLTVRDFPRLLFLGTGSSIPNKTRNTSGMLLEIDENTSIVIDCGEGTVGQIIRFYGQDKANAELAKIRAVYISHLHADHHLGLIGVLQGRQRAMQKLEKGAQPLFLLAPKQIMWWLNFYDRCFEKISEEFVLVPNGELFFNNHELDQLLEKQLLEGLQMRDISTCLVKHCPNAFGVSFVHQNGYKITYSGDTMPSENLVQLGKTSDLLIHEATMEDELAAEAVIKMHSTTSQAIEIGRQMEAKYTLLTHFSQRYAKLPRFNENFSDNVGIAFDNMRVKLDELPLIPLLYPALKLMFVEYYEEMEQKAAKRQMKIEREKAQQFVT